MKELENRRGAHAHGQKKLICKPDSPILTSTWYQQGAIIKPSSQAKALVLRSGKPFPHTTGESHPSQLPAVQQPNFTLPFPPSLVAWRKEEASCQRATQRADCSTVPPAPGTLSIPKPTPHHVPPQPPSCLPLLPTCAAGVTIFIYPRKRTTRNPAAVFS